MRRKTEPELLDALPADHPDARHFRRDMRLTNAAMGNERWFSRVVPRCMRRTEVALELGAGVGELCFRLHRTGHSVDGLDLWPTPDRWPPGRTWHRADLLTFAGIDRYPVILANMILHQFSDEALGELGRRLDSRARLIIACEPARRRVFQWLYRGIAPLFGANHVSRHDGHVSIAAGFLGDELPRRLGLDARRWRIQIRTTLRGAYRMVAERRE